MNINHNNVNTNLSEDDIFLDTSSLTSLDFSRALQNLSNQNLEDLLDFDPPESAAFIKNCLENSINDLSSSNNNLMDTSQQSFKKNQTKQVTMSPKKKRKYF